MSSRILTLNCQDIFRYSGIHACIHKFVCEHYTDNLLETVNFLSAGEMADMAESLISITSLHKHCTSSEESVGGPVNVAVITKAGGFRWVKTGERL